jgi:Ring finger domain
LSHYPFSSLSMIKIALFSAASALAASPVGDEVRMLADAMGVSVDYFLANFGGTRQYAAAAAPPAAHLAAAAEAVPVPAAAAAVSDHPQLSDDVFEAAMAAGFSEEDLFANHLAARRHNAQLAAVRRAAAPAVLDPELEGEECAVCLDRFEADRAATRIACGHVYHDDCLQSLRAFRVACCPLCRGSSMAPETEEQRAARIARQSRG